MTPLVVIILLQNAIVLQISTSRQIFRKPHHKPRDFKELASFFFAFGAIRPLHCASPQNFLTLRFDHLTPFV